MGTVPVGLAIRRDGTSTDPDHLRNHVLKALAGLLCEHTESKARACAACTKLADRLVEPVCRFAYRAAMGNRADSPVGKGDGYAALGEALEKLFWDCEVPLGDNDVQK